MLLETWLLYFLTCWGIAVVPGPNALLVLTHGVLYGARQTLATIAGGVLGFIVMVALCALGLGVLIQASVTWFTGLKLAGGLYLIWLGVKLWRAKPMAVDVGEFTQDPECSLFAQGLLAAASNPKAWLLYAAFIPPFMNPDRHLILQAIIIALTYAVVEFAVEYLVAITSHRLRPWLARSGRRFNKCCAACFVCFGVMLPAHA